MLESFLPVCWCFPPGFSTLRCREEDFFSLIYISGSELLPWRLDLPGNSSAGITETSTILTMCSHCYERHARRCVSTSQKRERLVADLWRRLRANCWVCCMSGWCSGLELSFMFNHRINASNAKFHYFNVPSFTFELWPVWVDEYVAAPYASEVNPFLFPRT